MSASLQTLDPRRIFVCQLKQIGDVLLTTPSIELLSRRFPEAEIHVLTFDYCAPVLENNPFVTKVWAIDKSAGFLAGFGFLRRAARQGYDLAVDFQQLPRCVQAMALTDAPVRLSSTPKAYRKFFYTHWTEQHGKYAAAMKSSILEPLGIHWNLEPPRLYVSDEESAWATAWLAERGLGRNDRLVTIDASHRHETHRWHADRFGQTMTRLQERYPDFRFLLLWGPGEKPVAEKVLGHCDVPERCILPEEQTTLRELAALMSKAGLHLGNCSAPRHFAAALDVPTMTIIGGNGTTAWTFPSDQHRIAHRYIPCHKCNRSVCPLGTLECLNDLTVDEVVERTVALLEGEPDWKRERTR